MIGRLTGILVEKQPPALVLDVRGVGYEVEAPMTTFYELPPLGGTTSLYTHLAVKEDAHSLYGFITRLERSLFRSLIRVSGIGPKLALTLLSGMRVEDFIRCIEHQDAVTLTRMPGVGKKTAERLVIEMRDRVRELGGPGADLPVKAGHPGGHTADDAIADAISALVALGYKPADAGRMVSKVETADLASEEIIRQALQQSVK